MKLIRLELNNYGVYRGANCFEFHDDKPVVLIGGMNGRGKTTILEAVQIALYGPNSLAFEESGYATFGQYLRAHTNLDHGNRSAYIAIEFELNEEDGLDVIGVTRKWDTSRKRISVETSVTRNGVFDAFLTDNWAAYMEDVLPHALSGFFFFDGEKIAELAIDGADVQIRESIRMLLGVSVVDVLRKDLGTICRRLEASNGMGDLSAKIHEAEEAVDYLKENLGEIDESIRKQKKKIALLEKSLEKTRAQYLSVGGEAVARRAAQEERVMLLREKIAEVNDSGVAISATGAPLMMFSDRLPSLLAEVKAEREGGIVVEALDRLRYELSRYDGDVAGVEDFLSYVKKQAIGTPRLGFGEVSAEDVAELSRIVEETKSLRASYGSYVQKKAALQKQLNEAESLLSISVDETAIEEIGVELDRIAGDLSEARLKLGSLENERSSVNGDLIRRNAEYKRLLKDHLSKLNDHEEKDRVLRYAHLADEIFQKYALKLQKDKVARLAATISDCYRVLANKKSLIADVRMDPVSLEMAYVGSDGNNVERQLLSAGEKQLLVIAILWALAKCSGKKLPVIIDTPLARLDSSHRLSVVTSYFPNASDQTIILSTDSEIFGEYYDAIKPNVSDEFTLVFSDRDRCTSIKHGYFSEAKQ